MIEGTANQAKPLGFPSGFRGAPLDTLGQLDPCRSSAKQFARKGGIHAVFLISGVSLKIKHQKEGNQQETTLD